MEYGILNIGKSRKGPRIGESPVRAGFSIIEMLISVAIFTIVAVISMQALASSLRSSKKSESITKARENVDYVISSMERLLRNAQSRTCASATRLNYVDEFGNNAYFECRNDVNSIGYIASNSATMRMTSTAVDLDCTVGVFTCPASASGVPESIVIYIRGIDAVSGAGTEGAAVSSRTKILLRNYLVY